MKQIHLILFALLLPIATWATDTIPQRKVYNGFSGGMTLHAGYQFDKAENLHGFTMGIGGAARVHLYQHWRIGGEGYVSTMPLTKEGAGSSVRVGWGGILSDYYIPCGKVTPFIGGTIGAGAQQVLHVAKETDNSQLFTADLQDGYHAAAFAKQSFVAFCPFIGLEYAITSHMHLVFRLDYLLCVHQQTLLSPNGPRLFFGFMFAR